MRQGANSPFAIVRVGVALLLALVVGTSLLISQTESLRRDIALKSQIQELSKRARAITAAALVYDQQKRVPSEYPPLVQSYQDNLPQGARVRLIRFEDKQLLAEVPGKGAPRSLQLSEKALFDQGKLLAAHIEQNRQEKTLRKPEVAFQADDVSLRLMMPYGGPKPVGAIEIHAPRLPLVPFPGLGIIWTMAGGALLLFALIGKAVLRQQKTWIQISVVALCTVVCLWMVQSQLYSVIALQDVAIRRSMNWTFTKAAIAACSVLFLVGSGFLGRLFSTIREHLRAYTYIAPAFIGILVLTLLPMVFGAILSFTDTTVFNQSVPLMDRWVGFENYGRILGDTSLFVSGPDGQSLNTQSFYWNLIVTILWTVLNVSLGVGIGLGLALLLNTPGLRYRAFYRVFLILPWAVPNYISALIWKALFHPQYGTINQLVQLLGGKPVPWFDGIVTSFITALAANVWLSFPFMMLVSLGALQSVNAELYQAAELDGASGWQQFRDVTLPALKPTLLPSIILSVMWTFNMFNVIYLVSGGEPGGANEILITKAFKLGFEEYKYGFAAAYSMIILALLMAYSAIQLRVTRPKGATA